jgi:glycosyltransferase involved in cell wall biosynthesis
VRWCGEVDSASFLADLDAFVMVSEPAGCPNALLEAMAAGLPLAATDAGGASEQVEDGRTGLLTPRGDARALGHAMTRIARDADLAAALGQRARERVAERFSVERMADAYERLLLA